MIENLEKDRKDLLGQTSELKLRISKKKERLPLLEKEISEKEQYLNDKEVELNKYENFLEEYHAAKELFKKIKNENEIYQQQVLIINYFKKS